MSGEDIHALHTNLQQALEKKHYKVDYYQREYTWGRKEVLDLLNDLMLKFRESYTIGDNPSKVQEYKQYYLGSFVINNKKENNFIIDGQQRLTTLSLIFAYISKIGVNSNINVEESKNYVYSNKYGKPHFNILVEDRIEAMEYIIGNEVSKTLDNIKNHRIVKNYNIINDFFENLDNFSHKDLEVFYYWLCERVLMVKITAYDDQEAYTIFESMNDRGLPITSLEMFKGYLLSLTGNNREKSIVKWAELKEKFEDEEKFNDFLILLFRAKFAKTSPISPQLKKEKVDSDWAKIEKGIIVLYRKK